MSVLASKRGESPVQFLDTAMKLEEYAIRYCSKFPKRYYFLITNDLLELSKQAYNNAKSANSVYANNSAEAQIRLNFVIYAICNMQCLASQIDVARKVITHYSSKDKDGNEKNVPNKVWEEWAKLISEELRLLGGLKGKIEEKYNLKDNRYNETKKDNVEEVNH